VVTYVPNPDGRDARGLDGGEPSSVQEQLERHAAFDWSTLGRSTTDDDDEDVPR
jgi:hypothetical protein